MVDEPKTQGDDPRPANNQPKGPPLSALKQVDDAVRQLRESVSPDAYANREGLELLKSSMTYTRHLSPDLVTRWNNSESSYQSEAEHLKEINLMKEINLTAESLKKLSQDHFVVLPDKVNALLHIDHGTAGGDFTGITKASRLAHATGQTELAKTIEAGISSTHFQGRLTPQQIEQMGIVEKFNNPALYELRVVNKRTGEEGKLEVNLKNFEDVGMAMENLDRMGTGQSIMGATEYTQLQQAKQGPEGQFPPVSRPRSR